MREIKFRAWNIVHNLIYYKEEGQSNASFFNNCPESIYKLMQFTGLKDKNGKEIYEGDVLRVYDYNDTWNDGAIGDVDWDEECGGFRFNWKILLAKSGEKDFRKPISTICSSAGYNSNERENIIEVIGNIYENPELLEEVGI